MTQKELLYVEDAIGHETSIINILDESIINMDDDNLVKCLKKDIKEHTKIKEDLLNLLEDLSNE